jgi:hypothetical protein
LAELLEHLEHLSSTTSANSTSRHFELPPNSNDNPHFLGSLPLLLVWAEIFQHVFNRNAEAYFQSFGAFASPLANVAC